MDYVTNLNEIKIVLDKLEIKSHLIEHEEVFTVDAMMKHLGDVKGLVCKNLFVVDKKKKRLWLIVACVSKTIKLSDIAKKVGVSGGFRFADEEILYEKLRVRRGCVTPLALYNDNHCDVTVILDSTLVDNADEMVYSHPMTNAASIGIASSDLMKFLKHTNHEPVVVEISD